MAVLTNDVVAMQMEGEKEQWTFHRHRTPMTYYGQISSFVHIYFFLLSRWRRLLRQMRRSVGFNLWFARNVTDFIATNLGLRSRPTEVHTHPTACNMIKCLMFNQCDDVVYVRHTVELDAKNMQEQSARKMCRERQSTTSIVHTQTVTLIIKNSIDRHTHRYIICR